MALQEWSKRKTEKKMKTFISAVLLSLMLIGCGNDTDKILASHEETNTKIDALITVLNEPEEATRKDVIVALFDSLVVYSYLSATAPTGSSEEGQRIITFRYVEYYVFQLNKSDLYDGNYSFARYVLPSSFRKFAEFKIPIGASPFIRLTNPEIYNFYGKWRILNEREIDMFREGGNYYSFREFDWKFVTSTILGANVYSFHGHKFVLGNSQGGTQKFVVGTINDLTSIKNGVFDTEL